MAKIIAVKLNPYLKCQGLTVATTGDKYMKLLSGKITADVSGGLMEVWDWMLHFFAFLVMAEGY